MTGRKWFVAGGLPLRIPLAGLALPRRVRIDGFFEIRAGSYGDPSHPFLSWSLDEDPILDPSGSSPPRSCPIMRFVAPQRMSR